VGDISTADVSFARYFNDMMRQPENLIARRDASV
jgi:hypothetical protein